MLISTRGRYALRVMLELAEQKEGVFMPMKEIAEHQDISLKYLERILPVLVKNGLLEGVQGKSGGYRLTRSPADYRVGEILRLTDGDLAPVDCAECHGGTCKRSKNCRTLPMWEDLAKVVSDYFDGITLADLARKE